MAETPTYFAVLTDAGAALEARALAEGKGVVLTHILIGDANLREVTPDPSVTRLVHEVHRRPIDTRARDSADPRVTLLHATIPATEGGWWINELGVAGHLEGDEAEVLYAYANHGRYYKMLPQDGQTITHELIVPIIQCTDARMIIQVADAGYATRQDYLALADRLETERDALIGAQAGVIANLLRLATRLTSHEIASAGGAHGTRPGGTTGVGGAGEAGGLITMPDGTVIGPAAVGGHAADAAAITFVVESSH